MKKNLPNFSLCQFEISEKLKSLKSLKWIAMEERGGRMSFLCFPWNFSPLDNPLHDIFVSNRETVYVFRKKIDYKKSGFEFFKIRPLGCLQVLL